MPLESIRLKIKNGGYEPKVDYPNRERFREGHIFDEEKSLKWNREEVDRRNEEKERGYNAYRDAVNNGEKRFEKDVIENLLEDFYLKDNKKVAEKIYDKAYLDGHSGGMYEVLDKAIDLADFVEYILYLL